MAKKKRHDTGWPGTLRKGSTHTEAALAAAADAALERQKVTQTEAAETLGLGAPTVVSMALALEPDFDNGDDKGQPYRLRYPNRGHSVRRAILRHYSHLRFSGDGEAPDGGNTDRPTLTRVTLAS